MTYYPIFNIIYNKISNLFNFQTSVVCLVRNIRLGFEMVFNLVNTSHEPKERSTRPTPS